LAQRNLSFVDVPNPGHAPSRITPQTFEVRPSSIRLRSDRKPDELRFDFSELPAGCFATVYLPAASSSDILDWSTRLYTTHRLTAIDAHTIRKPAGGTGWMPIPQGGPVNFAGLLTIEFPLGIRKGQKFRVPVSQVTSIGGGSPTVTTVTTVQQAESTAHARGGAAIDVFSQVVSGASKMWLAVRAKSGL
jgi:hypothetical protein